MISLHKNATTTPGIRQRLSGSSEPASVLALRYGVSEETARKWKRRDSISDLSATPHNYRAAAHRGRLQATLPPFVDGRAYASRSPAPGPHRDSNGLPLTLFWRKSAGCFGANAQARDANAWVRPTTLGLPHNLTIVKVETLEFWFPDRLQEDMSTQRGIRACRGHRDSGFL